MNNIIPTTNIENMIYEIRGKQVMLDSDLAKLYQCSNGTKTINQAVKRHVNRFPERFMFQLTESEYNNLWSQLGTASNMIRSLPYVFTEQGVAMLATVLRTSVAEKVSIQIMDAFVSMRKYISTNIIEQKYINNLVIKHDDQLNEIFKYFDKTNSTNNIYLSGQTYDAYSGILDILLLAQEQIIIIDNYADKYVLDMISKTKVLVTLVLSTKSRLSKLDISKYTQEYNNLTIIYNDTFHDRFIILDKNNMYHLGTSLNNAGTKTFIINKIEDERIIKTIIDSIYENIITN